MPETENVLTFGELRKKQKEEDREDDLLDLDDKFLMRVSSYLDQKKDADGESREYRNAKRVLDKIISIRENKIVKKAKLAVKTDLEASTLNLLPEEQELFRDTKQVFENHRKRIEDSVENKGRVQIEEDKENEVEETDPVETGNERSGEENSEEEVEPEEPEGKESDAEDGYKIVKIQSEVPEFMGTDLEAYGPFDEGEKVEIPEDNAEILVNRGNAELIEE
jgi:DNA replication initiation complex subunit (GINS family)